MKQNPYRLRIPDDIAELMCGMHPYLKKKTKESLKTILSDPFSGKDLKDELSGLRSFRVSRFRIIYRLLKNEVQIIAIGPRARIYQETYRIVSKSK